MSRYYNQDRVYLVYDPILGQQTFTDMDSAIGYANDVAAEQVMAQDWQDDEPKFEEEVWNKDWTEGEYLEYYEREIDQDDLETCMAFTNLVNLDS